MEIIQTKKRVAELVRESLRYGYFSAQGKLSADCANCGQRVDCTHAIYDFARGHEQRKLRAGMTDHLTNHCGECDRCGMLYGRHDDDCDSLEARTARRAAGIVNDEGNHA